MGLLELLTFQSLRRVAQLESDRVMLGDWSRVDVAHVAAFRRMTDVMTLHGIDTAGRPPVWAWRGTLRLRDAALLFDPEHELSQGFATVTFTAPGDLVVLSDYAHWCQLLFDPVDAAIEAWQPERRHSRTCQPEQACLPYVRAEWVTRVRPLPRSGWNDLDQEQPV